MLENSKDSSSFNATVKRYIPPNQRQMSGEDKLERANSYVNVKDEVQVAASKNVPILDRQNPPRLITLQRYWRSEVYRLMKNRWAAAMKASEDPSIESAERPVMYSGSGAAEVGTSGHETDF